MNWAIFAVMRLVVQGLNVFTSGSFVVAMEADQIAVDAKGLRRQRQKSGSLISRTSPSKIPTGYNVVLTIDKDLQAAAEEAFDGAAGAVVADGTQYRCYFGNGFHARV